MKTLRLFRRDLRLGLVDKWYIYLLPAVFAISQVVRCNTTMLGMKDFGGVASNGTVMDYILYSMQGMEVYNFDPRNPFIVPIYWFVFQIGAAYMMAYYSYDDLAVHGRLIFLSSRDRGAWWRSKCLWCITGIIVYFAVAYVIIAVGALSMGADSSMCMSRSFISSLFGVNAAALSVSEQILLACILPTAITIAVSVLQVLMSFVLTPVISFSCVCAVYVVSAYYTKWYAWGSYTMWLRSSYVTDEGVYPWGGILTSIIICILVGFAGRMYFSNKDIY